MQAYESIRADRFRNVINKIKVEIHDTNFKLNLKICRVSSYERTIHLRRRARYANAINGALNVWCEYRPFNPSQSSPHFGTLESEISLPTSNIYFPFALGQLLRNYIFIDFQRCQASWFPGDTSIFRIAINDSF